MKAIILAGGYGVRLQEDIHQLQTTNPAEYELYKHHLGIPKPLLTIAGQPIINHILTKLETTPLRHVIINTSDTTHQPFHTWKQTYHGPFTINILNDSTPENPYGHGVIASLLYAIHTYHINEDILLLAGDTIFDYELTEPLHTYQKKNHSIIVAHKERPEFIKQRGVVQYNKDNTILTYEEKPQHPKSHYAATPTFILHKDSVKLITHHDKETQHCKNMGDIIPWLLTKGQTLSVHLTNKEIIDVGNVPSVKLAEAHFTKKPSKTETPPP